MNKEKLEKIKHLLSYGDIKALDVNSFILTKTGAEKIINEYIKVSRVELPVMPNEVVDGGLTEEEQEFMEMIINWQMENPKAYERIKSFADVAISRATLFSALADYASQREA